jgi:hypothetical protein
VLVSTLGRKASINRSPLFEPPIQNDPPLRPRILAMLTTGMDERRSMLIYEVLGLWGRTANVASRVAV